MALKKPITPEEVAEFVRLGSELAEFMRPRRPLIALLLGALIAKVVDELG